MGTVAKLDPKVTAASVDFMSAAIDTGKLYREGEDFVNVGDSIDTQTIVGYLERVGLSFKDHLALYKVMEEIEEGPVNKILESLSTTLNSADEGFNKVTTPLFSIVFKNENTKIISLFEQTQKLIKEGQNKQGAEESLTQLRGKYTNLVDLKSKCSVQGTQDENEVLRIAGEQIEQLSEQLKSSKEEEKAPAKQPTPPASPKSNRASTPPPSSGSGNPGPVNNPPTPPGSPKSNRASTPPPSSGGGNSGPGVNPPTPPGSPKPSNNPFSAESDEEDDTPVQNPIAVLMGQIETAFQEKADKSAIKLILEKALSNDQIGALYGNIYNLAKAANPNDPALKDPCFGENNVAEDPDRLLDALTSMAPRDTKIDKEEESEMEEDLSPVGNNNPDNLPTLDEFVEGLAEAIKKWAALAEEQHKSIDQAAVKELITKSLFNRELGTLYGLIYEAHKGKYPNDPALNDPQFGQKNFAVDTDRLLWALKELPNRAAALDKQE